MKKRLLTILSAGLLLLTGCTAPSSHIRFGAAGVGGAYHSFGTAFSELYAAEEKKEAIEIRATAGSAANLRLLSEQYIQLGIAQADLIEDAYHGTGAFTGQARTEYKAIASLYTEACHLLVRADSNIQSVDDLQGKTVSIGETDSGTERIANLILSTQGLNADMIQTVNLNYADSATRLANGEIDGVFCTSALHTTVIDELCKKCDIRMVAIDDKCIDKILSAYDYYSRYTIPSNTYPGQESPVTTLGVQAILLAGNSLSEDTVTDITQFLFTHSQELQYTVPFDLETDMKQATQNVTIPFHPGAAAYYEENRISVLTE